MRRRDVVAMATWICAGCVSSPDAPIDPPEQIEWVAVIVTDARDTLVAASPLTRREDLAVATTKREGEHTIVAGYTAEALRVFGPVETWASARASALTSVGDCAERLPAPTWVDDVDADAPPPDERLPALYLPVSTGCPLSTSEDFAFEFPPRTCLPPSLYLSTLEIDDCLALAKLPGGTYEGHVRGDGSVCLESYSDVCPSTVHRRDPNPWATIDEIRLVGGDAFTHDVRSSPQVLQGLRRIHDLATTSEHVFAILSPDEEPDLEPCMLASGAPRIAVVHVDTMQIVATSTLPPCTRMLAAQPDRDDVLAIGLDETQTGVVVSRVGIDGVTRIQASAAIPNLGLTVQTIGGAFVLSSPPRLVVVVQSEADTLSTSILAFELPSLASHALPPALAQMDFTRMPRGAVIPPGAFLLVNERTKKVGVVDLASETFRVSSMVEPGDLGRGAAFADGQLLVPNVDLRAIHRYAWRPGDAAPTLVGDLAFYDVHASPFMIAPVPTRANRAVVLAIAAEFPPNPDVAGPPTYDTYAGIIDLDQQRVLPNAQFIGTGPVSNAMFDAQGRLWIAMAWSGTLLRLTPLEDRL